MVVLVGIDVHKATHCAVAVDELGRAFSRPVTVRATDAGHLQLLRWAARSFDGALVRFAVEDCRHVSTRLERALLGAGATVVRVPPKLMAGARASARTRGKSDPIDAPAIARAALREPDLPRAEHTHASREVKLLVDHREDLVGIRTSMQNRLRWHLHELDPELDPVSRGLDRRGELDRVQARLEALPEGVVVRIALELLTDIRSLTERANALEKELAGLVRAQAPQLLDLPGCGVLTAAKLLGETANPARFRSEACFAVHAGVGPRSRRPPARPTGTASPAAATASSTSHCTASRSPRSASTASAGPTTSVAGLKETPHGSTPRPQEAPRSRGLPAAQANRHGRRSLPSGGGLT